MVANSQRVRALRENRGWTQEELAANSGTTDRTVQRIEAGQSVRADSLRAIANALEVEFTELLPPCPSPVSEAQPPIQEDPELQTHYTKRQELLGTVAKLCRYWEDQVPGARLTEREAKNAEKWLRKFSYDELLTAMDTCIQQYVEISPNGLCTPSSNEYAWGKIPSVCFVRSRDPEEQELYMIRGSARYRLNEFDDAEAMLLLKSAQNAGVAVDKLRMFASIVLTWDAFKQGLVILTQAPSIELSRIPSGRAECVAEVLPPLPGGAMTEIKEHIAIVAVTKSLAASADDIANEILKKAQDYGEIVITIDAERRAYYFGQTIDGNGRMYGINQTSAARALAESVRNNFEFLQRSNSQRR